MILNDILSVKRRDLEEMKRRFPFHRLRDAMEHAARSAPRPFYRAVSNAKGLNLICELKRASPSAGVLRDDFQPLRIASLFEFAGAAAISVLTETHYFKGRPSYLKTVRQVTTVPLLRKDFILESYQIYETALLDADAFLLIASILTGGEMADMIALGAKLGMDALVEVHTAEDVKKAVGSGARIIGINNRDLKTLEVDPHRAKYLIPLIPKEATIVIESGLSRYEELMEYKSLGVNSFLVGTSIMRTDDIVGAIYALTGSDRKWKRSGENP
jgi:indole-3-glycerol phosphate synthase